MEAFFLELALPLNALLVFVLLFILMRSSEALVDGAIHLARELRVSPLIIGATVVAVGTSAAELAVNLTIVLGTGDTTIVIGNILGSNLVNIGIGLGVPALIAGTVTVHPDIFEKDMPLCFTATGLATALILDGEIGRVEAIFMLVMFVIAMRLIAQYARAERNGATLRIQVTTAEAIAHPAARQLTFRQALLYLFGGLAVLALASRVLMFNTAAIALKLGIPQYIIGLTIIGVGTSMCEISSAIQAARQGYPDMVFGMAFGSNLFNLLFGLGLPALIRPLAASEEVVQDFIFMNVINLSLLVLLLLDFEWLGTARTINRLIGAYLVMTYVGFIAYAVSMAAGVTLDWPQIIILVILAAVLLSTGWLGARAVSRLRVAPARGRAGKILCATRGGEASRRAQDRVIELALQRGAELVFLYVVDTSFLDEVAEPIAVDVESQIEHMKELLLTLTEKRAKEAGVTASTIVREGKVHEQIKAVAVEEGVDQVVLGSPTGESNLVKREALRAFAAEIEEETGIPAVIV